MKTKYDTNPNVKWVNELDKDLLKFYTKNGFILSGNKFESGGEVTIDGVTSQCKKFVLVEMTKGLT